MDKYAFDSHAMLLGVSRTFALTIPLLPFGLRSVVANAYLLCRIADTIEDDKSLDRGQKKLYSEQFIALVQGSGDAAAFAGSLASSLSADTAPSELELVSRTPEVIAVTHSFNKVQIAALSRCIGIMANGMAYYQQQYSDSGGLPDMASFDHYCYCVAGVVGELLTELFCDYAPDIAMHRRELMRLSILFGQGLQMTNILKDVHEDGTRGACWLPRDVFADSVLGDAAWRDAMLRMVALGRGYLWDAVRYSLLIPKRHKEIRRFCLWAVGMAVWTLRGMAKKPDFANGNEVKISRRAVYTIGAMVRLFAASDALVRLVFAMGSKSLPAVQEKAVVS